MEYNELSRRGLIDLNTQYDAENNMALREFMMDKDPSSNFERIRPFEEVADKIDAVGESIRKANSAGGKSFLSKMNSLFNGLIDDANEIFNEFEGDDEEDDDSEDDNEEDDDD